MHDGAVCAGRPSPINRAGSEPIVQALLMAGLKGWLNHQVWSAPRVSLKEYMMVGPLRDEMVDDVAVILMTGWLTPWRFGDAAAFMSVRRLEK